MEIKDKILESCMHANINNDKEIINDIKWYFKEKHGVMQKAINNLRVTVNSDSWDCVRVTLKVNVWNKPSFQYCDDRYDKLQFLKIRKDIVQYKEYLDDLYYEYYKYYQAAYEAERKVEIQENSEKFARAAMTMFNINNEPQVPTFCSCCGAKLNVETHNCDYCGTIWVRPE